MALSKDPEARKKQLANLVLVKKGVNRGIKGGKIGYPKGKARTMSITGCMKKLLKEDFDVPDHLKAKLGPKAEAELIIGAQLLIGALSGNRHAIREVIDRIEGKAIQKTEITGLDGGPLAITDSAREFITRKLLHESAADPEEEEVIPVNRRRD